MFNHEGKCQCGKVTVLLSLPAALDLYKPRQCNCDFCASRGICYLSHPNGNLTVQSVEPLHILKQGSNQASFVTCAGCNVVIAVSIYVEGQVIGSLNASLLDHFNLLQKAVVVSPKTLDPKDKLIRWKNTWGNIKFNVITG